jgi:hypothetical protein
MKSANFCFTEFSKKFVSWCFCEVRTIPQAIITLPCLPGLSFPGLREAYSALGSVGRLEVREPPFLGRRRGNVEPVPGVLSVLIWPPWASAIWRAMDSPRPAPPSEREGSAL